MESYLLSNDEGMAASSVAALQMLRKITKLRNGDHGGQSKRSIRARWADTIAGIMGEMVVAKSLKMPWTPGGMHVKQGDVDNRIEVRTTEYQSGHLLVYPSDPDDHLYYLVVGEFPEFRVPGFMFGRFAKANFPLDQSMDPPCHKVPQSALQKVV